MENTVVIKEQKIETSDQPIKLVLEETEETAGLMRMKTYKCTKLSTYPNQSIKYEPMFIAYQKRTAEILMDLITKEIQDQGRLA